MSAPVFVSIANRYLNASTIEEMTFNDAKYTINVVYNNGNLLSEEYDNVDTYKRMKMKLNKLLRLGTLKEFEINSNELPTCCQAEKCSCCGDSCDCGCQAGKECNCNKCEEEEKIDHSEPNVEEQNSEIQYPPLIIDNDGQHSVNSS